MDVLFRILVIALFLVGCSSTPESHEGSAERQDAESVDRQEQTKTDDVADELKHTAISPGKARINSVDQIDIFADYIITSSINKILDSRKKEIYKPSIMVGAKSKIELEPDEYAIQFRCQYTNFYNYNWVKVKLEANEDYVIYCLGETNKKGVFGTTKVANFFPFVSKTKDLVKDKAENQKIIDSPSQEILTKDVADGKTRLIIYNLASSMLGFDNSFPFKISINGTFYDNVDPRKYLVVELENGTVDIEVSFVDVFTFKKKLTVQLDGGKKYVECSNSATSALIGLKADIPNNFQNIYKPQYPFKSY